MRKTAFFEHFARCPAKSVRKHCFFHVFRDTLYNVRLKFEKNDVFWAYARLSTKSCCVKSVFTRFLRHFVRFCKKCDKQRSLIVLRDVPQKLWEKWVFFSLFSRHYIQSSHKCEKQRFLSLCLTFRKKCEKTVFHIFRDIRRKFAKNAKNSVFWAFCAIFRKKF